MSIYCSLGSLWLTCENHGWDTPEHEVYFQAVPGHIGHPKYLDPGETDVYAAFLPPAIEDEHGTRAVVVLDARWDRKEGQRYVSPLLVLSGEEWATTPFPELWQRIEERIAEFEGYGDLEALERAADAAGAGEGG